MRAVLRATSTIAFALVVTVLGACADERPVSQYPSLRAAQDDGADRRGWIPVGIPDSATSLWEQHDIDSNVMFLRFELPTSDRAALVDGLKLRQSTDSELQQLDLPRPWARTRWFETLIQKDPSNDSALHASVYEGTLRGFKMHVVVDQRSEFVYAWTAPR